MAKQVIIALGANIGDTVATLKAVLKDLAKEEGIEVKKISSLFRTAPWGYADQQDFTNVIAELVTDLPPLVLLDRLQALEKKYHRQKLFKNGPRTLDLDIITYEKEEVETEQLTVPHPCAEERAFVLYPLMEILPNFIFPNGHKVADLVLQVDSSTILQQEPFSLN
ncbi:MAG: 2-amino-4-hydroxy-6-hydroxymethyldihydropteridine diphosphokinase [Haemophilus parainfluenzae]|jgi:2-amino-4-hydroxy-6-hydroxymethyldihydropteridine diphosphokinase|nr:MAG: 2-amino-4-hydroxy-6-hydroxymethyldihydropteridine diphosphokinase [Haemophilus parainfluenzae]